MPPTPPSIDPRTASDIINELRIRRGQSGQPNDLGDALISMFAAMVEGLITRMNTIPERNYLAFLDMIGATVSPPRPARTPLTFAISDANAPTAIVPQYTQVASAPADGLPEAVFETEQNLVVTATQVVAAYLRDPNMGTYADYSAMMRGEQRGTFPAFIGNQKIAYYLYLACDSIVSLPQGKQVHITINFQAKSPKATFSWSIWDGQNWVSVKATQDGATYTIADLSLPALQILNGITARWLRAQLQDGPNGQPIAISQIAISQITIDAKNNDTVLLPVEQGFANGTRIDPTTTIRPFGERPHAGDVLYLNQNALFALKDATVTLHITLASEVVAVVEVVEVVAKSTATLAWHYWDGSGWQDLNAKDETMQFTESGTVTFVVPRNSAATTVGGVTGFWIRVLLSSGNYGTEPRYELVTIESPPLGAPVARGARVVRAYTESGELDPSGKSGIHHFTLAPGSYTPPLITALSIGYSLPARPPDACLAESDLTIRDVSGAAMANTQLKPFITPHDTTPTLYLGLDRPLPNRPVQVFVQVAPAIFDETAAPVKPSRVVWEYAASPAIPGEPQWNLLGAQDQTRNFTERGMVAFLGPHDHQRTTEFGRTLYWLRARRVDGVSVPQLGRISTNTVWASHATTIRNEELGSSDGSPQQRFRTNAAPVLAGQQISIREPLPPAAEQAAIRLLEGADAIEDAADSTGLVWVRWHAVPDFYASGARDRHYLFDCVSGEIRFGNGQHGLIPPQGRGNIRASAYRTGGGLVGNRAAGSISQLKTALAYIAGVTNYEAASGGSESEPIERIQEHGPHILRHNGRAVAAQDYEDLAREASSAIARAMVIIQRAINPLELGQNYWIVNPTIKQPPADPHVGYVDLVVVPYSDQLPPSPSLELIRQVEAYLNQRAQPMVKLRVLGPYWVLVSVAATIVPITLDAAELPSAIAAALRDFLHPLNGGPQGQGWPFGRSVYESDIYAFLETLPGVDYVTAVTITAQPDFASLDKQQQARSLIYPGDQSITMVAKGA